MGKGFQVEKDLNAIKEGAYDIVLKAVDETIKVYKGEPVIGKEAMKEFIRFVKIKLDNSPALTENESKEIVKYLEVDEPSNKYTGGHFKHLTDLVHDLDNVEWARNALNNVIGIQEKKE
jgi:hypothetical protein